MGLTKKMSQIVQVTGKGDSKVTAFASALSSVSKKVLKDSEDVLIRIEPTNIAVLFAKEKEYTERFLFFFFPRKRTNYEVELMVEVEISLIEAADIVFTKVDSEDPNGVTIPFTSRKI
ncbi:DUF4312 family protein [Enterococcus sp. CWB-B31]|uniref:DUF4312 family protein n=1 Tax=Enterococcus sp. CWB-B31 TaxID=2885159 RepID=UPI001E3626E7|nr:DUF4312 family protein [Enterococcus sp. CWB-B31]MCB5954461.1 DUF4312 family protein [Enterococcus sp. CWB-B31]